MRGSVSVCACECVCVCVCTRAESILCVGSVLGIHHALRRSQKRFGTFCIPFEDEGPEAGGGTDLT